MNIYLVNEDGEENCVRAETMTQALKICLERYLNLNYKEELDAGNNMDSEIKYYHENILKSCNLVGRLIN